MDRGHERHQLLKRYGLALAWTGFALLIRGTLPVLEGTTIYQLPLAAVVVGAWLGGRGPGYLAAAASVAGIAYWFLPPTNSFAIDPQYVTGLCIYVALCVLLVEFSARRWRDMAQLRRAQAESSARQELLDLAQKAARAVAFDWHIGARERENRWSPELEAMYGLQPGTFDGTYQGWKNLVHPDDWPAVRTALEQARTSGDVAAEYRVLHEAGAVRWLRAKGRMFLDGEGQPERMVGFMLDVTDWRRAEERLRLLQAEMAHANRVITIGELTASIAHEVNQPLGAMVANAGACARWLAADPPQVEKARKALDSIAADGKRASEVVGRIRALTRRQAPRKDRLDVNQKIVEVLSLAGRELRGNDITVETRLDPALPRVTGDRVQLQQVLLNLVVNAIDAMNAVNDRPRRLTIVSRPDGVDAVTVEVRDSGTGLDALEADRLFEAFYTTKADGMGIGLSISRSIIEAHGGRLFAAANEPHGAVFRFSLPVAQEVAA